ncbi:hypothetical protein BKA62DRAFT_691416 [Auriculariales sp. MPI-PUGE-AT-0066]|nr:hypothetical protein BKA62DRAFT_691416 [Auriculariales sp. MPI-PUGE-AT-0066]
MFTRLKRNQGQTPASAVATQAIAVKIPAPADLKRFGLENFGNTCYVNAIFQALYFCGPFRELVLAASDPSHETDLAAQAAAPPPQTPAPAPRTPGVAASPLLLTSKSTSKGGQKRPATTPTTPGANGAAAASANEPQDTLGIPPNPPTLFSALRSLFWYISQNQEDKGSVSPLAFVNKVRKEHDTFRSAAHQDAHEFMNYLLNKIGEEIEHAARERERVAPAPASEDLSNSMTTSSRSNSRSHAKTFVHALFEGVLTSETRCLTCENVSARDESFIDLSIDIEQNSSVTACLRSFSASEMLCQRNKFFCDSCCGLQEAEKRMKIKKLPNVLALHLKRFKFQEDTQKYVKLAYRVAFPNELRLFNTVDAPEGGDPDRRYELFAIVVHIGAGPHHGHYIAIVRTRDQWLIYDDNNVDILKDEQIPKYFGDAGVGAGYVLFYQAVDIREAIGLPEKPAPLASPQFPPVTDAPPVSILNGNSQPPTLSDSPPQSLKSLPDVPVDEGQRAAKPQLSLHITPSVPSMNHTGAGEPTPTVSGRGSTWIGRRRTSLKAVGSPAFNGDGDYPPPVPPKSGSAAIHEKSDQDEGEDKEKDKGSTWKLGWRRSTKRKQRESMSESASTAIAAPKTPTGSAFPDMDGPPPTPQIPPEFANVGSAAKSPSIQPPSAYLLRQPSTDARRGSLDTTGQAGHGQSASYSHGNGHGYSHSTSQAQAATYQQSSSSLGAGSILSSRSPSLPGHPRPPSGANLYTLPAAQNASTTTTTTVTSTSSSSSAPLVPPTPLTDPANMDLNPRQRKDSVPRSQFKKIVNSLTPGSNTQQDGMSDSDAGPGTRKRVTSALYVPPLASVTTNGVNGQAQPQARSHSVAPPPVSSPDFSYVATPPLGNGDIGASPRPVVRSPARKMSLSGGLKVLGFSGSKDKDKEKDKPQQPLWESRNGH